MYYIQIQAHAMTKIKKVLIKIGYVTIVIYNSTNAYP